MTAIRNTIAKKTSRSGRVLLATTLVGLVSLSLSGCGSAAVATCDQYAAMSSSTGLFSTPTSDQANALKVSLDAAGYDDGALNQSIGHGEVIAYCNIYEGVAGNNGSQLISNAH